MNWKTLTEEQLAACLLIGEQSMLDGALRAFEWFFILETVECRVLDLRQWPENVQSVILQPFQFSCFNPGDQANNKRILKHFQDETPLYKEALKFTEKYFQGNFGKLGGRTRPNHYMAYTLYYSERAPMWSRSMRIIYSGGEKGHVFLRHEGTLVTNAVPKDAA